MRAYANKGGVLVLLALMAVAAFVPPTVAQHEYQYPSKVNIAWNRLNTFEEVEKILRDLTAAYPEMLKLESIGKSIEGRDIWLVTLNIRKTGPAATKPAMYIDGNIHGNEAQAGEAVLYTIWYLTKSYGKVEQLTALLDRCAFYFLPVANPDGRAYWFREANNPWTSRGGQKPVDNDGDGLFDEDPPNDLDGDGQLLQMRREDPHGEMRESPDDPRIMVPIDPESKGTFKRYKMLGTEGVDDDGDGEVNEDGPGGYDPNRDWPADWQPNYVQDGAGEYPLRLPESKAVADFVLAHPNIAAVQAYHNFGGMILRGPGGSEHPYPPADVAVYDRIARRGEKMLPFYRYMITWRDLYVVRGGFSDWTAEDLGIISFTNELWSHKKYYDRNYNASDHERMEFNDLVTFGEDFVGWKKFEHPVYGEIELGGWVKLTERVPPAFALEEDLHRNFAFTMYHAEQMPLIELENVEVKSLGDKLWRVRVDVHNARVIPTTTVRAAERRYGPRDFIALTSPAAKIVAGGTLDNRFTAPFEFVKHSPHKLWIDNGIPGESVRTFQWLVHGDGEATIRFSAARAKDVSTKIPLR